MMETEWQLTKEWSESLRRVSANPISDWQEARFLTRAIACIAELLATAWQAVTLACQRGGLPAPALRRECDRLLGMAVVVEDALRHIAQFCQGAGSAPEELESIRQDGEKSRRQLEDLVRDIQKVRALAAASPRLSPDLLDVQQRARKADERGDWQPLKEAVARLRQDTSTKEE